MLPPSRLLPLLLDWGGVVIVPIEVIGEEERSPAAAVTMVFPPPLLLEAVGIDTRVELTLAVAEGASTFFCRERSKGLVNPPPTPLPPPAAMFLGCFGMTMGVGRPTTP